jgi:DNA replication protein DnaC
MSRYFQSFEGLPPHVRVSRIAQADLIVIDDIGRSAAGHDAAEAFYRVVDAAYEGCSVAVSANLLPFGFDSIMPKTVPAECP